MIKLIAMNLSTVYVTAHDYNKTKEGLTQAGPKHVACTSKIMTLISKIMTVISKNNVAH